MLCEISLGATAIDAGITADPRYAEAACRHLSEVTGLHLRTARDLVSATTDMGVFMQLSLGQLAPDSTRTLSRDAARLRPRGKGGEQHLPLTKD
jgi:aspartate ammonia-lyase